MPIACCSTRPAAFVLAGAAELEGVVLDAPDDDDDMEEDEDSTPGVVEVLESRLVEFTREARETLVVEDKWIEGMVLATKHVRSESQMTTDLETHVVEPALVFSDVRASDELVEWVSGVVDGAALCVDAGVDVELAGGAHSAATTTWTSSSSCVVHCCCRQLNMSCWIFLFAHRHFTSFLHTPTHASVPQRYGVRSSGIGDRGSRMGITRDVHGAAIEVLGDRLDGAVLDAGRHLRRELGVDARESENDGEGDESEVHSRWCE